MSKVLFLGVIGNDDMRKSVGDGHRAVMLEEAVDALAIQPNGFYIDGTYGRGGHAKSILKQLSGQGRLLMIDKDVDAICDAKVQWASDERAIIHHGSFIEIGSLAKRLTVLGHVQGILLDLGVSSPQLDEANRGFSFLKEGPLDMRMNKEQGDDAATWLNRASVFDMADVLKKYGEERHARRIAQAIDEARRRSPINTTTELAGVIAAAAPTKEKHKHPATRSFQAIRIFINRELEELEKCLEQCLDVLAIGGRLVVVSFHSLEDRIVKQFIRRYEKGDEVLIRLPIREAERKFQPRFKRIGKAVRPSEVEVRSNPRARSAVMRIAEKIA